MLTPAAYLASDLPVISHKLDQLLDMIEALRYLFSVKPESLSDSSPDCRIPKPPARQGTAQLTEDSTQVLSLGKV